MFAPNSSKLLCKFLGFKVAREREHIIFNQLYWWFLLLHGTQSDPAAYMLSGVILAANMMFCVFKHLLHPFMGYIISLGFPAAYQRVPHHAWTSTSDRLVATVPAAHNHGIVAYLLKSALRCVLCGKEPSVSYMICISANDVMRVWGYFFLWAQSEAYVIVLQQGWFTTSKEHVISICELPSVFSSLSLSFSVPCPSLLPPPSSFSAFVRVSSPSPLSSFPPAGKGDLNFEQKAHGGKLCRNIWSVFFPTSLFWEMSSTPKEQFQKKHKVAE